MTRTLQDFLPVGELIARELFTCGGIRATALSLVVDGCSIDASWTEPGVATRIARSLAELTEAHETKLRQAAADKGIVS